MCVKRKFPIETRLVYPYKSLDGFEVNKHWYLAEHGQLNYDRRYWLQYVDGTVFTAKYALRNKINRFFGVEAKFNHHITNVCLDYHCIPEDDFNISRAQYSLTDQTDLIELWMSEVLGERVSIMSNLTTGAPDNLLLDGPTFLSVATIGAIAELFSLTRQRVIRAFRPNLILSGLSTFEEFRFIGKSFFLGDTHYSASKACPRCEVVSADPDTGERIPEFAKKLATLTKPALEQWTDADHRGDDHGFYIAVNTKCIGKVGKMATVGNTFLLKN